MGISPLDPLFKNTEKYFPTFYFHQQKYFPLLLRGKPRRRYQSAAFCPAIIPDDHAHCKLNPPHCPSISIISPEKNNPFTIFDSMVLGLISFVLTPPAVTCALGQLFVPLTLNLQSTNIFAIFSQSFLETFPAGSFKSSIPASFSKTGISLLFIRPTRLNAIVFLG